MGWSTSMPLEVPRQPVPPKVVSVMIVSLVFMALCVLAIVLRVWSRRLKKVSPRLNDYAAIVALIFTLGLVVLLIISVYWAGFGLHLSQVSQGQYDLFRKLMFITSILWGAANCAVKISILDLYIVIFRGPWFKPTCYGLMLLSIAYAVLVVLEKILLCTPIQKSWEPSVPGSCTYGQATYLPPAVTNLALDVAIIVLPLPVIWSLQMPLSKKLGVAVMFSLGVFIVVISVMRLISVSTADYSDSTYSVPDIELWSILEPALGIINCCLPVMMPALSSISKSPPFAWISHSRKSSSDSRKRAIAEKEARLSGKSSGQRSSSLSGRSWRQLTPDREDDAYSMSKIDPKHASAERHVQEGNAIGVTREWEVHSEDRTSILVKPAS